MGEREIAHPGSALEEAIGHLLESEIHHRLRPIAESRGAIYITAPGQVGMARKKLILTDQDGNDYDIDAVIVNHRLQPLVLLESKYIRYKKHNQDKASRICTAHSKLRQRFPTIRSSIAVLMGSWSRPSKRLLRSFAVTIFEIGFDRICEVLQAHGIHYAWAEKDQQGASEAWQKFQSLTPEQTARIAQILVDDIGQDLEASLRQALDESSPRDVREVKAIVETTWGETFVFAFRSLKEAVDFMNGFEPDRHLDTTKAPALLTP